MKQGDHRPGIGRLKHATITAETDARPAVTEEEVTEEEVTEEDVTKAHDTAGGICHTNLSLSLSFVPSEPIGREAALPYRNNKTGTSGRAPYQRHTLSIIQSEQEGPLPVLLFLASATL